MASQSKELIFRTGHLYILSCVVGFIWCIPNIHKLSAEFSAMDEARTPARMQRSSIINQTADISAKGDQAIARIKTGACIPMIGSNGLDVYFSEVTTAHARTNGAPLVEGQMVCNVFGETGVVGPNGSIEKIAVAPVKDKEEYDEIFSQLVGRE